MTESGVGCRVASFAFRVVGAFRAFEEVEVLDLALGFEEVVDISDEGRRGEFTAGLISCNGRDVEPSKPTRKESSLSKTRSPVVVLG